MSESNSSVPDEVAEVQGSSAPQSEASGPSSEGSGVEERSTEGAPSRVELDIDQDKLDAWDAVKGDYQVDPNDESVPDTAEQDDPDHDDSPEDETDATKA